VCVGGAVGLEGSSKKGGGLHGGLGAVKLRKETTEGLRARGSVFQFNFSLSRKPLYRLVDPLSLSQSFLPLSTAQKPSPAPSQVTPLGPDRGSS